MARDGDEPSTATSPRLVCLLPVRNGGDDLPTWLDEAQRFADAVVALDDGSTDDTSAVLGAHPLVVRLLVNRPRSGHLGWHDGLNRNRLLAAAAELSPGWVFSLDADERLDPTDADALRQFIDTEPMGACAYGFQHYRMLDDEKYDPAFEVVYRLFRFRPGQRFHQKRLGCVPVPTDMPAWVPTTLRIKHYGDVGDAGREARLAKLRAADPDGILRFHYENLPALSPGPHPAWEPRDVDSPVLAPQDSDVDLEAPVLSVVVVGRPGQDAETAAAANVLRELEPPVPTEILTVVGDDGVSLANRALQAATGDYVLVLSPPTRVDSDVLGAVVDAHEQGHALVGGTARNLTNTAAGWADALLAGDVEYVSFAREPVLARGGVDGVVARTLLEHGLTGATVPELDVPRRPPESATAFLRHRFRLGRSMGRAAAPPTGVAGAGRAVAADAKGAWQRLGDIPSDERASRAAAAALIGAGAAATWLGAVREKLSRRGEAGA